MPTCLAIQRRQLRLSAAIAIVAGLCCSIAVNHVQAQSYVGVGQLRPFVVGFVPTVGNGAVGGVSIDAAGVVNRSTVDQVGELARERASALSFELSTDVAAASDLRKVSLRRLEQQIYERLKANQPLDQEMMMLAGLQNVQFIFLDPDNHDVIIAGKAEGWTLDKSGTIVGAKSQQPVLQLEDLLVALRSISANDEAITCSIDPSAEGLARLQAFFDGGPRMGERALRRMEQLVGPQAITLTGIPSDSHYARVMVSSDFLMKRIAMGLEKSPVRMLPSYMQMLKSARVAVPKNAMPRWWLAPDYAAPLRDTDGLAYALPSSGVKVMTEDSYLLEDGTLERTDEANPAASDWASRFNEHYAEVAGKMPVFAELRNIMDLTIVAAIAESPNTEQIIGHPFPLLTNPDVLPVASYHVPQEVASQSSFVKKGNQYVISVSGGVDIAADEVLSSAKLANDIAKDRAAALPTTQQNWWWD